MNKQQQFFGSTTEALLYPFLLLAVMWLVFWADYLFPSIPFYKAGVMPKSVDSLHGIVLMPLLHAQNSFEHIVNNSLPTAVLLGALIYYYRSIAWKVFVISWLFTGIGLWVFAENNNSYHIGMSGVIYALVGFLFTSGVLRKYLPLQAISLFVVFVYGSLIWGIFPMESRVSWEGHLSGLVTGVILAFIFRRQGPQAPKYLYEVEKEMGIEPPDLEGEWMERVRQAQLKQEEAQRRAHGYEIVYHYRPENQNTLEKEDVSERKDDTPKP